MNEEDALRLARLSEEIRARHAEINMIIARVAGVEPPKGRTMKHVARDAGLKKRADAAVGDWMEIDEIDGFEVCWGVIDGQPFAESPCGGHA
jgi:hypothetical protein